MRKIVYLLVKRGDGEEARTDWKPAGSAFVCRDGSLNMKLDVFPDVVFNIRDAKSKAEAGEAEDMKTGLAVPETVPVVTNGKGAKNARPKRVRQVRK